MTSFTQDATFFFGPDDLSMDHNDILKQRIDLLESELEKYQFKQRYLEQELEDYNYNPEQSSWKYALYELTKLLWKTEKKVDALLYEIDMIRSALERETN